MEHIRHLCAELKLREYIHNIEDARCHRMDLEEATDDIEVFMQMFEPIAESISNFLQNGKDVLDTMNADLENLEAYTQEKEECIEELSQIIQEELNKQKHDQQLVADLEFSGINHANHLKSLNAQMLQIQREIHQLAADLMEVEGDILTSRNLLVETTSECSDLETKIADLHHFEVDARAEFAELDVKHIAAQARIAEIVDEKRQLEEHKRQYKAKIERVRERLEMEQQKPVITPTPMHKPSQDTNSPSSAVATSSRVVSSTPSPDEPFKRATPSGTAKRSSCSVVETPVATHQTQQPQPTPVSEGPPAKRAVTQRPRSYIEEEAEDDDEDKEDEFTPPPTAPVYFTPPAPPKRKRTARVLEPTCDNEKDTAEVTSESPTIAPPPKTPLQKRDRKPAKWGDKSLTAETLMEAATTVTDRFDPLSQRKEKRKQKRQSQLLKARGSRKSDPTPARAHSPSPSPLCPSTVMPKPRVTRSAGGRALASKTMAEESILDRTVCSDDDDYIFDG